VSGRTVAVLDRTLTGLTRQPRRQPSKSVTRDADKPGLFAAIRRDGQDGHSIRALAARHQVHRRTIHQALADPAPPPRRQMPLRRHALDRLHEPIAAMLAAEPGLPIPHIWERLLDSVRPVDVTALPRELSGYSVDTVGRPGQRRIRRTGCRRPEQAGALPARSRCACQEFPVRSSDAATAVTGQIRLASPLSAPRRGSEYAELSRLVREAGLLERRPGYYVRTIAVTIGLLAAGWTTFVVLGNSWWQLAVAAFLAVVFTQIGFLGHDAGHRQVFSTRRASYVTGILLGNLGIGLSYCWWVDKHNRHHAHPNTEDADPDIAVGALAFSSAQAGASRGLARLVFRYQAYLFFPLLLGEAVNLHVASVRALTRRAARRRSWERALITVHAAGYLTAVFLVLSPVKAVVFIIVQQGLFGLYLGSSFAPNHKGMPILDAADRSDFLRRQALTSRNVRGGRLTDFALGGLNYQIEHHLFPSMPRPNLRRSQALIEAFCRLRGVPYCQSSLAGSYAQALRYLNTVGRPARPGAASAAAARP
jgi:fatty acid desaturase